jgi:hypothetical protein
MIFRRSHLRSGVLEYFYRNPVARSHVRGLAEILKVDSTNLSRELRRLATVEGFLKSEQVGRNLYYSINWDYPEIKTVIELMEKLYGPQSPKA